MGLMLSRDLGAWPVALAVPLILLLGTAMGLVTGSVVTYGRVPSIIATLGLLTALRGITTLLMGGQNIDNLPASLTETMKQPVAGLPVAVWTAAAVVAATSWLLHHTPLGRRLFALGSSAYSARMAGLSEHRLKLFVFAYTGLTTAIATLVDVPRLPKIEAGLGAEFELLVVTCVVVGGVSIAGGRGTLTGVVLAAILLTMVRPVLTFLDVGEAGEKWTKAIQGLFIVLAMVGDDWARRRSGSARSPGRSSSS
jgi:ribose/xylose/arabinose/galactoside ABC-type transport system permease subunit